MPLEIKEKLSLEIELEGEKILVYFRRPNAEEMVNYLVYSINLENDEKKLEEIFHSRIELAKSCLLGIREGDIIIEKDGIKKELITESDKPGYVENWKNLIYENFSILLFRLANHLLNISYKEQEQSEKK